MLLVEIDIPEYIGSWSIATSASCLCSKAVNDKSLNALALNRINHPEIIEWSH